MIRYLFILYFLCLPLHDSYALFTRLANIEDPLIKRVVVSSFNPTTIYVASKNSLFKSEDSAKNFSKIAVYTAEEPIHFFSDARIADISYLATSRHIYKIGQNQEKLFTCPDEASILCAAKYDNLFYVGTTQGLYNAQEDVLKWRKIEAFGNQAIYYITPSGKNIYIAAARGVYVVRSKDNQITRSSVLREKETTGEEESGIEPHIVYVDIFNDQRVWLGTNKGIFVSDDSAKTWQKFYADAVTNLSVYSFAQTKLEDKTIYIATDKGLFRYSQDSKTVNQLFEGLSSAQIFWVTFTSKGELLIASSDGVYRNDYFTAPTGQASVEELIKNEPAIAEIQQAALRYNEAHPDKIKRWRRALKARALFPTVSWSYDKTIYGTSSGQFAVGPRDWGLTFAWNIGDLVWNSYEDDIDTRSRLNTELRLDILDEVNRVYFERLRLKHELATTVPEQDAFQKNLRLQELTATLDGYTGGHFSKRLRELSDR